MAKLFSTTMIVSGIVALALYFMFVAPMLTKETTPSVPTPDPVG